MYHHRPILAAALAALLSATVGGAVAQQRTTSAPAARMTAPNVAELREVADANRVVLAPNVTVSTIDDYAVYAIDGTSIGEVDEVLENAAGQIVAVSLDVGGFLGVGEKEVVVPISSLQLRGDRFVISLTKQQIEALPAWAD